MKKLSLLLVLLFLCGIASPVSYAEEAAGDGTKEEMKEKKKKEPKVKKEKKPKKEKEAKEKKPKKAKLPKAFSEYAKILKLDDKRIAELAEKAKPYTELEAELKPKLKSKDAEEKASAKDKLEIAKANALSVFTEEERKTVAVKIAVNKAAKKYKLLENAEAMSKLEEKAKASLNGAFAEDSAAMKKAGKELTELAKTFAPKKEEG